MKYNRIYFLDSGRTIGMCSFGALEKLDTFSGLKVVFYFLPGNVWAKNFWKWARRFHTNQRKSIYKLIVCTNELSEWAYLRSCGISAIYANQNMLCNEHKFFVEEAKPQKLFDAVYAAALAPFKRLHLVEELRSLFVVTYKVGTNVYDLHQEYPGLSHVSFNRSFLGSPEVRHLYNQSRCGLALSRREGAMWASMEYQLCGLPVVSTKSRGGRFKYYDEDFWIVAQPSRHRVRIAVQNALKLTISPDEIRCRTLEKMAAERKRFYRMGAQLAEKYGAGNFLPYDSIFGGEGIDGNSSRLPDCP